MFRLNDSFNLRFSQDTAAVRHVGLRCRFITPSTAVEDWCVCAYVHLIIESEDYVEIRAWWRIHVPLQCHYLNWFNTFRPRQKGHHFADDIFKCIFLNENIWIPTAISLTFVPQAIINNIPASVQIIALCHPDDNLLSEPMMISLRVYIFVTQPQWVNHCQLDT